MSEPDSADLRDAPPQDDPALEEIRAIRRRLWEEAGGDIERYIEHARLAAARHWTPPHEADGSGESKPDLPTS